MGGEFRGSRACCLRTLRDKALRHVRRARRLDRLVGNEIDYRLGRALGRDEAVPVHHPDALHTCFREGRHPGKAGARFGVVTASARRRPFLICTIDEMMVAKDRLMRPPSKSPYAVPIPL